MGLGSRVKTPRGQRATHWPHVRHWLAVTGDPSRTCLRISMPMGQLYEQIPHWTQRTGWDVTMPLTSACRRRVSWSMSCPNIGERPPQLPAGRLVHCPEDRAGGQWDHKPVTRRAPNPTYVPGWRLWKVSSASTLSPNSLHTVPSGLAEYHAHPLNVAGIPNPSAAPPQSLHNGLPSFCMRTTHQKEGKMHERGPWRGDGHHREGDS